MQESKKFLGMETSSLPIIGLLLTLIALFTILSNFMNSKINRLDYMISMTMIELKAESVNVRLDALEREQALLNDRVDALTESE